VWFRAGFFLFALATSAFAGDVASAAPVNPSNSVAFIDYHSWTNVVSVNNGLVEALIVPADGRVQQFRFLGETNGALWENPSLYGRTAGGARGFYSNFGGDKAWPSPQSVWRWPPPKGFDGGTNAVTVSNGVVTLVTPVDRSYNIQTTRIIELLANEPVMRVRTIFQRMGPSTRTNALGVWIDCQASVTADSRCYVPVPANSQFTNGYTTAGSSFFTAALPGNFTDANRVISFGPDGANNHKLGFDGGTLVLVGPELALRLDAPRVAGADYPDGNCSTEVYTAGSDYFELELLGPMAELPVDGQMEFDTEYRLIHRTEATADAEAQKILSAHH
jgi:hypothetical protein